MDAKIPKHIQALINEAKTVQPNTTTYWKLRCRYLEKNVDTTYGQEERDNCFMLWRILMNREA